MVAWVLGTRSYQRRDFGVGRPLRNLPALRSIGFAANRRMLETKQISHDCALADDAFQTCSVRARLTGSVLRTALCRPQRPGAAARVGEVRLRRMQLYPIRSCAKAMRCCWDLHVGDITPGRMSYELRRLRLHSLIVPLLVVLLDACHATHGRCSD